MLDRRSAWGGPCAPDQKILAEAVSYFQGLGNEPKVTDADRLQAWEEEHGAIEEADPAAAAIHWMQRCEKLEDAVTARRDESNLEWLERISQTRRELGLTVKGSLEDVAGKPPESNQSESHEWLQGECVKCAQSMEAAAPSPSTGMDPYERAVRLAEEWQKTDETRKFLVAVIELAEEIGGFDHETRHGPTKAPAPTVVTASATSWKRSAYARGLMPEIKARASGVALPPKGETNEKTDPPAGS
jgi:hypothetical protein